jgi:hypothetical protein
VAATSPIIPELPIIRAQGEGDQRATFFELFFDLVYVFARSFAAGTEQNARERCFGGRGVVGASSL